MKKSLQLILLFALSFCLAVLVSGFVGGMLPEGLDGGLSGLVSYVVMMGGTIGLLVMFSGRYEWRVPNFRMEVGRVNPTAILISLMSILSLSVLCEPLMSMIPESYMDGMYESMEGGLWSLATLLVVAPILEEYLFRGILQRNLVKYLGRVWGIVLASALFGAVHIVPQQVIMAFLSGMVIGLLYEMLGSMTSVIFVHILNNGIAYSINMYLGRGIDYGELFDLSERGYLVMYLVCSGFVMLMVGMVVRKFILRDRAKRAES